VTVLEVIQRSSEYLARKGVESPRLQIELLLAHVLQMPRLKLYLNFSRVLNAAELDTLRGLVQRRATREPLQHILGSTSFCGLEMAVTRDVLVPRPETELLAERGWEFLQRREAAGEKNLRALDFGTGSGCLAIALAVKVAQAQVSAIEISETALKVARENAGRHQVTERIQFYQGDGFAALPSGMQFDLLVSNPPYISSAEIEKLEPEVRDYDPRTALDGGSDGLDYFRRLAVEAPPFLAPDARLMLEFADGQEKTIPEILEQQDWTVDAVEQDYSKRPRILIAHRAVY
jgi:release factor glutamine methyltransferase